MKNGENREAARDILFLMADLRIAEGGSESRIQVRNLSSGGMMGEGAISVSAGALVEVNLRSIGWVSGKIAWVQNNRFGVAFDQPIDPRPAHVTVSIAEEATPRLP